MRRVRRGEEPTTGWRTWSTGNRGGRALGAHIFCATALVRGWTSERRRSTGRIRQWTVLGLERGLDPSEGVQGPIEGRTVVRGHHARAQQRPARRHRRMHRDVDVDPRVVERLPQQGGPPVVLDQDRDDGRDDVALLLDDLEAQGPQAVAQVAGVVEHARHQLGALGGAHDAQRRQRRADGGGDSGRGEQEGPALETQEVDDLVRSGDEAAAAGQRLGERAHPQVDAVLHAEQLGGAGAARPEDARAVGLVNHEPRAVALGQVADRGQRRDVALHREDAVDHDQDAAAVARRALQLLFELVEAVVAERAQLGARQQAAVEDRGVVGRVGEHGVAGGQQRAERAEVGLVAGGEDERLLGAHPGGQLALELKVQGDGPVEQPRPGQPGAIALQRVARALLDALVAGEPEVVVGAEHHALGALHLDHGPGGPGQLAEVGQRARLADRAQERGAVEVAGLREDVDGGRHIGCAPPMSVEIRPVQTRRDRRAFVELPFGLYANDPVWIPPLRLERRLYLNRRFNPFLQRAEAQLFLAERDGRVVGRISAHVDPRFNEQHEAPWGWFGFLEVEDDAQALDALLDAA